MRVMHESEKRDRERDRAALRNYEKRMGFRRGRDRISIAAFPMSQRQHVDDIFDEDEDTYIGEGKRWVNAPRMDKDVNFGIELILLDVEIYSG